MIARLTGRLAVKSPEGLVVDVNGVGYRVLVSLNAFAGLPAEGERIEIPIHTHMRESSLELFGFGDVAEKALFLRLIAVSGVGPRMALTILSGIPTEDLIAALAEGNVRRLVGIPGIGKRTAERLIVELQDKMQAFGAVTSSRAAAAPPTPQSEAVSALVNLGYRDADAEKAVREAVRVGAVDLADVIREALKTLSG
jgi:holliday junction DNA helicase RuvA